MVKCHILIELADIRVGANVEKHTRALDKLHRGFTLVELMVAVALLAVLLAMGVPSFKETIERNQLASQANEFISSLSIARSEAVKRGKVVTVCKSVDGSGCSAASAGYEVGWIVFVDENGDGVRNGDTDELLQRSYELKDGYTLRGSAANALSDFVSYRSSGRSNAVGTGSFVLCKDSDVTKSRSVIIEFTGRVHIDKNEPAGCV